MIIQTDKEGRSAVEQLCDIALKQGGVHNLNQVNIILKSVRPIPVLEVKENSKPKSPEKEDEAASPAVVEKKEKSEEKSEEKSKEEDKVGEE